MSKSICVIGAGASGLACIKECLDAQFNVTCYEQVAYTGGLWRFHDEDVDEVASVTKATIINSSKEVSAYSDFPPQPDLPNYCHNSQLIRYFDSYADHFGLKKHVKFRHQVNKVEQRPDGKWLVKVTDLESKGQVENVFDGVMISTGHHTKPHKPHFEGLDKFKGTVMHTHSYKRPNAFQDKKIVIVGIGNSAGDAAVELSAVTDEVYLSTRTGAWVLSRVYRNGLPMDYMLLRRSNNLLKHLVPYSLVCHSVERELNQKFDHELYGLKPRHRVFGQHPFVNDALPNRILSGTVKIKKNVERFTEDGVVFQGENGKVTPVDVVILATGYETCFPFLGKEILDTSGTHIDLFKYAINPHLKRPESLMFIGLIQPYGPLIPISEIQARWFCQLQLGRVKLPSKEQMIRDIEEKRRALHARYYSSPRHTMQVDFVEFMDEIAEQMGAKPNLLKYFFLDPALWRRLFFGPCVPYQFRLDGPGKWSGARKAILEVDDRTQRALGRDPQQMHRQTSSLVPLFMLVAVAFLGFFLTKLF